MGNKTRVSLCTGAAGYIGSIVSKTLLDSGSAVVGYDNLSTGHAKALSDGVEVSFGDVQDTQTLASVLRRCKEISPDVTVYHFAGSKSVAESNSNPLKYFYNNVQGLISLLRAMAETEVYNLVFSSSATVYGNPIFLPLNEQHPVWSINPYGASKLACEDILRSVSSSSPEWRIGILRYFNPVGSWHEVGLGEHPTDPPPNVMPYISQVAYGLRDTLKVFGGDYTTPDGTGVRDYIHIRDLADVHVLMGNHLRDHAINCIELNVGTGIGYSVLQVLREFERVSGATIPFTIVDRRAGDAASVYCDTSKVRTVLGWKATRNLTDMCLSTWEWQTKYPRGYHSFP